jgi:transcriptional regulator with AAA-type ATPase domain
MAASRAGQRGRACPVPTECDDALRASAIGAPSGETRNDTVPTCRHVPLGVAFGAVPRKGETLSHVDAARRRRVRRGAYLCLELECERPLAGPARWRLTGLERIRLSRGVRRAVQPVGTEGLGVEVGDAWMSSEHLEIRSVGDQWVARDLGSKNGTFLDGERIEEAALTNGSLLLVGHTLLRFRTGVPLEGPSNHDFESIGGELDPLTTLSPAFERALQRARSIAPTRVPVLITGESGTGKEVLARAIHAMSRRHGAMVAVNCGAIPANLVEAELFGHKKGAFSGADQDRPGLVKASDGGTLFLDELGDLPHPAQAALLRVLQEAEVLPIGGHRPTSLNLRVLAATHHDLGRLVKEQRFRHDLLARLDGVTLVLPPLRERAEDLPLLIALLLRRLARDRPDVSFIPAAAEALLAYPWPLNVRELEQALAGALALSGTDPIDLSHLPPAVTGPQPPEPRELNEVETVHRDALVEHLRQEGGNVSAVARVLGKHRTQVTRWLAKYGIEPNALGDAGDR